WALASQVAQARSWGMYFDSAQSYAEFVKDPMASFNDLLTQSGTTGQPAPSAGQMPGGGVPVEGVELDMQKLNQIIVAGPRRIYRIVVTAQIGEDDDFAYRKRLEAVWDREVTPQNNRDPAARKGAWVYWRED
ncbi:MAG TPA: hypothetical protein VL172_12695, partial [Kofleriaceae bacterium]|nr:hypothetical protein [Kofleriaceae bacterium]